MTCGGCENAVKRTLQLVEGIEGVTASYKANLVGVEFDAVKVTPHQIEEKIEPLWYKDASRLG